MEKAELRRDRVRTRDAMSAAAREHASNAICATVCGLASWVAARRVALYSAIRSEVSLTSLLRAARAAEKTTFFPRCTAERSLGFVAVDEGAGWRTGPAGIPEPLGPASPLAQVDMVLVPLVGFDRRGGRLGYGGGYYDRALADYTGELVAVGFACQEVDRVPRVATDIPMPLIVTEREVIRVEQ